MVPPSSTCSTWYFLSSLHFLYFTSLLILFFYLPSFQFTSVTNAISSPLLFLYYFLFIFSLIHFLCYRISLFLPVYLFLLLLFHSPFLSVGCCLALPSLIFFLHITLRAIFSFHFYCRDYLIFIFFNSFSFYLFSYPPYNSLTFLSPSISISTPTELPQSSNFGYLSSIPL